MLSEKQKRIALKKNIEYIRDNTRRLRDDGVEEVTLTWYADEDSFHKMRTSQEGDDFDYRRNCSRCKVGTSRLVGHGDGGSAIFG
jgi:hypothetical protein